MEEAFLKELKENYQIEFKNIDLLTLAFTHSSYVNEHQYLDIEDNERIEFLGDAVLELIVSRYLYLHFPNLPEGELTKLRAAIVCEDSFSKLAKECHFDRYIRLGKGEENMNGRERPALLCDLFESFVGALYLDQGLSKVTSFVKQILIPKIETGAFSHVMDHKTHLQEVLQREGDAAIKYEILSEEGPAHDKHFVVQVSSNGEILGVGEGKSKKNAEQAAAENTLLKKGVH